MSDKKKIGIIIADGDEFLPLKEKSAELGAESVKIAGRRAYRFTFQGNSGSAEVTAVHCGIGKVNAAAAATALAEKGVHIILNCGLSGGISGVVKNELCLPDKFLEHDFDLSGIGYKHCEKPGQEYIYSADAELLSVARRVLPSAKVGTAVTGDCFVQNDALRDFLKDEFSAMSCDMETAAVAYVCYAYGIGFLSVRKISDDAGNDAVDSYRELNALAEDTLINAIFAIIREIL